MSNVVGILNGMPEHVKVRLFTTDKNDNFEYDDVSNMHLAHLQFTFPSVSKTYDLDEKNAFLVRNLILQIYNFAKKLLQNLSLLGPEG